MTTPPQNRFKVCLVSGSARSKFKNESLADSNHSWKTNDQVAVLNGALIVARTSNTPWLENRRQLATSCFVAPVEAFRRPRRHKAPRNNCHRAGVRWWELAHGQPCDDSKGGWTSTKGGSGRQLSRSLWRGTRKTEIKSWTRPRAIRFSPASRPFRFRGSLTSTRTGKKLMTNFC